MVHKLSRSQNHQLGGDWVLRLKTIWCTGGVGEHNLVLLLWFHISDISTEDAIKL